MIYIVLCTFIRCLMPNRENDIHRTVVHHQIPTEKGSRLETLLRIHVKPEPHIRLFSENGRERWARIGEQVICGSAYSYILGIRHYALNTFSTLPDLPNRRMLARILVNAACESQFSQLHVNLCENAQECWQIFHIRPFSENGRICGSGFIYCYQP